MIPYQYVTYTSEEVMDLFIEFMKISDNPISFEVPSGFVITSDMMNTMILAAYNAKDAINPVA